VVDLGVLPQAHPLRNRALAGIGAYRHLEGKPNPVQIPPSWNIAKCTYNDLGGSWVTRNRWYFEFEVKER